MDLGKRLENAKQKMGTMWSFSPLRHHGERGWQQPIDQIYSCDPKKFFNTVDEAKSLLATIDQTPLKRLSDLTVSLRIEMERQFPFYFGKTHLAVALAEMGFRVLFENQHYFVSDYRSGTMIRSLRRGRKAAA